MEDIRPKPDQQKPPAAPHVTPEPPTTGAPTKPVIANPPARTPDTRVDTPRPDDKKDPVRLAPPTTN